MNLEKTIEKIESDDPAIGIGTAAAATGILAARLVIKIANKSGLKKIKRQSNKAKKELINLIKKDMKAYDSFMKAYRAKDEAKMEKTLKYATETPIKIAEQSYKIMEFAEVALEEGKKSMVLEAYGAACMGEAAVESALEIAEANIRQLGDKEFDKKHRQRMYSLRMMSRNKKSEIHVKSAPYIYKKK